MLRDEKAVFTGQLQGDGETTYMQVVIEIDDGRFRMWAGRTRLGSWALDEVAVERISPFRFSLTIEETRFSFVPENPTGFSQAVGAVVDLRSGSRFGLAARLRQRSSPTG